MPSLGGQWFTLTKEEKEVLARVIRYELKATLAEPVESVDEIRILSALFVKIKK